MSKTNSEKDVCKSVTDIRQDPGLKIYLKELKTTVTWGIFFLSYSYKDGILGVQGFGFTLKFGHETY